MAAHDSLLKTIVELGIAKIQTTEEVQARQVIFGGALQVCLLELAQLKEPDLLDVVSHHFGQPTVAPGPLRVDLVLSGRLRSEQLPFVAIRDEDQIHLASDGSFLEPDLSKARQLLDGVGSLLLTTELRLAEAIAYVEGAALDERQSRLLDRWGSRLPPLPPVEDDPTSRAPEVESAEHRFSERESLAAPAPLRSAQRSEPASVLTPMSVKPEALPQPEQAVETGPPPQGYEEIAAAASQTTRANKQFPAPRSSYTEQEAERDLASARTRDRVVEIVTEYMATRFRYVAAFGVSGDEAKGLKSSASGATSDVVRTLTIALDLPSCFKTARDEASPRVTRLRASGLEGGVARDLARPTGMDVLLVPIGLRGKTVLLLWGDNGDRPLDRQLVSDVARFTPQVSEALERVLLERKRKNRMVGTSNSSPHHAAPSLLPEEFPLRPGEMRKPHQAPSADPSVTPPPVPHRLFSGFPSAIESLDVPSAGASSPAMDDAQASPPPSSDGEHEVAPVAKRHLGSRPAVPKKDAPKRGNFPSSFPAEAPRTLKGFPSIDPPSQSRLPAEAAQLAPASTSRLEGTKVLSRRIVPLGDGLSSRNGSPSLEIPSEFEPESGPEESALDNRGDVRLDSAPPSSETEIGAGVAPPSAGATMLSRQDPALEHFRTHAVPSEAPAGSLGAVGSQSPSFFELVDALLAGDARARETLIQGGETAVGALIARFPGPVEEPQEPSTKASECGPILEALVALGSRAIPFLTVRTADEDATVRRWATFVLGELPGKESARAIASRLLDQSIEVRRAALSAARRLRKETLARRTLRAFIEQMIKDQSLATEQRTGAIEALSDIREHEAIPTLLQLMEDEDPQLQRSVRWALRVLTRQDFGDDLKKWRSFWQQHRDEDRVEWLIASLDHEERDIRRSAGEELRIMAGDAFGFDEDQPAGERRDAQARFRSWWNDGGKANS